MPPIVSSVTNRETSLRYVTNIGSYSTYYGMYWHYSPGSIIELRDLETYQGITSVRGSFQSSFSLECFDASGNSLGVKSGSGCNALPSDTVKIKILSGIPQYTNGYPNFTDVEGFNFQIR